MRDKVNRPEKSFAFLKAGTALAVAAALTVAPLSASPAFAFEIFGMKFFEDEEDAAASVIDPVNYTLTLNPGTDDDELKDAIENTALLKQDEGKPVSGDLGLVIKARDDLLHRERANTGRGQLNRQWDTVEPATHLHYCRCVLRREREGREDRPRALNKQLNGLIG